MTSTFALRRAAVALIAGALAVSACGGGTAAPSSATATSPQQTFAPTTPPVSAAATAGATDAPASTGPVVDPAEDLQIGAPYSLRPLDESIAQMFVTAMEQSLGAMADVLEVGVREVVNGGQSAGLVIVMRFPGLPVAGETLLEGAAQGAAQGGAVESQTIAGNEVRIVQTQGQTAVITLVGDDLVMVIGGTKKNGTDITTAIFAAN